VRREDFVHKLLVSSAAIAALLVGSATAQASSITLTFGTGGTSGFTSGTDNSSLGPVAVATGLDLTVSPWSNANSAAVWDITASSAGFGVFNGTCDLSIIVCLLPDSADADSSSSTSEGLTFSFSAPVTLTNATFGQWGNSDVAAISAGGALVTNFGSNSGSYSPGGGLTNSSFFFQAIDNGARASSWRLSSLRFDYPAPAPPPPQQPLATPEPSSILLLGGGLVAAARRMRRRK
jgi:hypothetical protein